MLAACVLCIVFFAYVFGGLCEFDRLNARRSVQAAASDTNFSVELSQLCSAVAGPSRVLEKPMVSHRSCFAPSTRASGMALDIDENIYRACCRFARQRLQLLLPKAHGHVITSNDYFT